MMPPAYKVLHTVGFLGYNDRNNRASPSATTRSLLIFSNAHYLAPSEDKKLLLSVKSVIDIENIPLKKHHI